MLATLSVLAGAMVSNLLILVGLTYLVSIAVARVPQARTAYHGAIFGLMLGVIAALQIYNSIQVGGGALLDLRYVAILVAGLIGGPIAALVTTAIGILSRLAVAGDVSR